MFFLTEVQEPVAGSQNGEKKIATTTWLIKLYFMLSLSCQCPNQRRSLLISVELWNSIVIEARAHVRQACMILLSGSENFLFTFEPSYQHKSCSECQQDVRKQFPNKPIKPIKSIKPIKHLWNTYETYKTYTVCGKLGLNWQSGSYMRSV